MTKYIFFSCICFMNVNSFWNINSFILQRCFKFIIAFKIFYEFNHIFFSHAKHEKSVAKVICMYYWKISKRFYSTVTFVTNFWIRFKTIIEIVVMADFTLFWFIRFIKVNSFRMFNSAEVYCLQPIQILV